MEANHSMFASISSCINIIWKKMNNYAVLFNSGKQFGEISCFRVLAAKSKRATKQRRVTKNKNAQHHFY
jgi:hypothetical protein